MVSDGRYRRFSAKTELLLFLATTVVFSGSCWLLAGLTGGDVTRAPATIFFLVGACGPSVAALLCWLFTGRGRTKTGSTAIRSAPRWIPVTLVFGVVPSLVAALVSGQRLDLAVAQHAVSAVGGPVLFVLAYLA